MLLLRVGGSDIARHWLDSIAITSRSFLRARYGIYRSLKIMNVSTGDEILVPSYVCRSAIDPIASCGAVPVFHDVNPDCSPDLADMERRITRRTRGLMAVHYFGFSRPLSDVISIKERYGLFLIEDCAHVLPTDAPGRETAPAADFRVFSWRKFFPLYDGGSLAINRKTHFNNIQSCKTEIGIELRALLHALPKISAIGSGRLFFYPLKIAAGLWHRHTARIATGAISSLHLTLATDTPDLDLGLSNHAMSRVSHRLLTLVDAPAVIRKRRTNFAYLSAALADCPGVRLLHQELLPDTTPWVFPLIFDFPAAHLSLRTRGIPAVTWRGVQPQLDFREYPVADFLYDHLVFLPVHQSLSEHDLNFMIDNVRTLASRGAEKRA